MPDEIGPRRVKVDKRIHRDRNPIREGGGKVWGFTIVNSSTWEGEVGGDKFKVILNYTRS